MKSAALLAFSKRWFVGLAFVLLCVGNASAAETLVHKVAESFDETAWPPEGWNKATGVTSLVDAAGARPAGKCLDIEVRFSGKGFEWFAAAPKQPMVIPGDAKSVQVQYKLGNKRYPLVIKFKDGWGRSEIGKKKLEWALPSDEEGQWKTATFKVPADWVRPIAVAGMATHNWAAESDARAVHFGLDQLEVETDIHDVDPQTGLLSTWKPNPEPKDPKAAAAPPRTPLVTVEYTTGRVSNLFSGEEPMVAVSIRNWHPGKLEGTLSADVTDFAGTTGQRQQHRVSVDSTAFVRMPIKAERFGLYTVKTALDLSDGQKRIGQITLARLARVKQLLAAEKRASPYGINVNGGRENFTVEPFCKAGIVWFRDYGFSYDWLQRAKGDDRRYAGWPWYPTILQRYRDAGAMVLPCLMRSITAAQSAKGTAPRIGPDRAWNRQIADIVNSFPEMTHWELDNEYDLDKQHADFEASVDWRNYGACHRTFAEIVQLLGAGEVTAVEQGSAGIYPDRVRRAVESGDFAKIGVVNSHYYCGTEAPEVNVGNWNTGPTADFRHQPPMLLFDRLRAVKQAATSDGRPRESWLTEFGWDTLAGPRVSPYQQAAYLARGWMLNLASGTDKSFWFYDYDAADPKIFFDGCGLLTADGSPKLSLCALAGLTSVLPNPKYVGSIDAGPGTCGFVFAGGEQLVAAMWSIQEDNGPQVTFHAKELRDYLGNRLSGLSTRLSLAPVYAVGLEKDDPLYRQTAYELSTPHLVGTTAGDPVNVVLEVRDNRSQPIDCKVRLSVPEGWKADSTEVAAKVSAGKTEVVRFSVAVPLSERMGSKEAKLTVLEREVVKEIPIRLLVQAGISLEAGPLRGKPGPANVAITLTNRSAKPVDGALRLRLPKSWKAAVPETSVKNLAPDEARSLECGLTWNAQWQPGEQALVEFDAGTGKTVSANLIPGRFSLRQVKGIKLDGRADDWPAEAQLPEWLTASAAESSGVKIFLGWANDGLYGMVDVPEADLANPDPRNFWTCNCLELFVDSHDNKQERSFVTGDHQFWFVPMVADKRVYAGQWKRGEETSETRYDLDSVQGVALPKGRGYVMEFRLPAKELKDYAPRAGASLGLNVNLSIKGTQGAREVCWPAAKNSGAPNRPSLWGSVELVP